jgi:NitT/TauT family transport system permease protein
MTRWLSPKDPIPRPLYATASALMIGLLLGGWAILAYSGSVRTEFLPTPSQVLKAAAQLAGDGSLWRHIGASSFVVLVGFALASVIAVPLGIVMGSFALIEALMEPIIGFVRYLPVSAMIPLLILWIGIDYKTRLAVIVIGTCFQQIAMVADIAAHVPRDLLDVSYTLGASRTQVVARVLIPATLPGVIDTLRVTLGWAWTYVVLAELVAANEGLGYLILNSMRGLFTDRIFVGIMVIGFLGLVCDLTFKYLHRWLLPWSPKVADSLSWRD